MMMNLQKIKPIFLLPFSLFVISVFAQDPPPGTKWKLDKIEVAGPRFRWDKAVWSGNQILSEHDLESALAMKSGAIADEIKINRGWREVSSAYGKRGYVMADLKISPSFNDEQKTVGYQVAIEEGAQYRMGQLQITGLPDDESKKLHDRWKMKPGAVFDSSYPGESVAKAMRDGALSSASMAKDYGAQFKPDQEKLTVDVVIQFK